MKLTKRENLHEIRFETFMLNLQHVLHGQTSNLKTPGPKSYYTTYPSITTSTATTIANAETAGMGGGGYVTYVTF